LRTHTDRGRNEPPASAPPMRGGASPSSLPSTVSRNRR
jgi:hypothetical protein